MIIPGVRTQAVDLLTQKREPELVGVLQELMTRENNNYVRMKCQRAACGHERVRGELLGCGVKVWSS